LNRTYEDDLCRRVQRQSAEQGNAFAMLQEGRALIREGDAEQGVAWLEKSVAAGQPGAAHELGMCLYDEPGVKQDRVRGRKLLLKAAAQGDTASMVVLACLANGRSGRVHWFRQAAEAGDVTGMTFFGEELVFSLNAKTRAAGVAWLQRAAHGGDGHAFAALGKLQ
jgi:TPR repeat protein